MEPDNFSKTIGPDKDSTTEPNKNEKILPNKQSTKKTNKKEKDQTSNSKPGYELKNFRTENFHYLRLNLLKWLNH
jgi:hypothetical protein